MFETINDLASIPAWLGGAAAGAIVAAITYIAKTLHGLWTTRRETIRVRYKQLLQLESLLKTSNRIFDIQQDLAERLMKTVIDKYPDVVIGTVGYEETI